MNYNKFIVLIYIHAYIFSQISIGEWGALTSPLNVRDLTYNNNTIYAASEGGLLQINENDYRVLTTIDGLKSVDLLSISYDHQSFLWLGGASPYGFLQIFDPLTNLSVQNFDFGLSSINDIIILDSLTFVLFEDGQDFGIMKFLFNEEWEYRDSFKNFPEIIGKINCISANNTSIFIGSDNGIFIGKLKDNLKDPNNWSELNENIIFKITSLKVDQNLIAFTSKTKFYNYFIEEEIIVDVEFSYDFENLETFHINQDSIWLIDDEKLYLKDINRDDFLVYEGNMLSSITSDKNNIFLGTSFGLRTIEKKINNGFFRVNEFIPNSPVQSGFTALAVLDDGRLVGGNSKGLSIYSEEGWRNILEIKKNNTSFIQNNYDYSSFISDTIPYDFGGYIADIEQGPDGLVYCAIRGSYPRSYNPDRTSGGILIIDIDDPSNVTVIDTTYLSYHTTSSNSTPYMLVLDLEFDKYGNLWILDPYCINGNQPVHVKSPEGNWKHYGSSETATKISQSPVSIVFDSWDRVWYSAFQAEEANLGIYPNGGIFMLEYEDDPINPINFSWLKIQDQGTVWSLSMGSDNRLYYLTPNGLNYFDLSENSNPVIGENNYPYFPNISFGQGSELKIDSHSNIWAHSSTQGIHVLLENTTYWPDINGYRTSNSPLLSDEITDIVFDEKINLAYIATSKGINTLRIPFGKEKKNLSEVIIFPSPFIIPSDKSLKVDGLPYNYSMMIMTLDGQVIRKIDSQGISIDGDQLIWDGKDENGYYVSSGVYLIALHSPDKENSMEKITVIKR